MIRALSISSADLHATILPRGATLAALRFGEDAPSLVLAFADPADHFDVPIYAGSLVGPVANRIARGQITLDGVTYHMPRNENNETCLHSGPLGLHALPWQVTHHSASEVTLAIELKEGDHGLPGNRNISASYRLEGRALILAITAESDRPTPMNIAAHPYWKLDREVDVSGHSLRIDADHYLPVDARNLPTGEIAQTAGHAFDFRTLAAVPAPTTLDVNFCLNKGVTSAAEPSATLIGASGTRLDVSTTAPGLQVYNGAALPRMPGVLDQGADLRPCGAIALEPQFWPDAPHHPHFPQITLQPGEIWKQVTRFDLTPPP